jgi:hypothetical protein
MDRRFLSEDERSILCTLLNERMAQAEAGAALREGSEVTRQECQRLLRKIDGSGKVLVIECEQPFAFGTDSAVAAAEESGCG